MKYIRTILLSAILFLGISCSTQNKEVSLQSPDGSIQLTVSVDSAAVRYVLQKNGQPVIRPSVLGFDLKGVPSLGRNMKILSVERDSLDNTWEQVWGEQQYVRNHYNELLLKLQESGGLRRCLNIRFRAFNDGVGFRYEFPEQTEIQDFVILGENTEFNLAQDAKSWSIPSPAYGQRYYESLYREQSVSSIKDTVTTPLTVKYDSGLYLAIHEAGLTDYAKMNLYVKEKSDLKCELTPWSTGEKVFARTPFSTPWRTVIVAENAGGLLTSRLMLNLNEPNKIANTDFIQPAKYVGIWWGMHMNKYTWKQGTHHGATTGNVKRYIDFAAANNMQGVLVEGWNEGWNGTWENNGDSFRFAQPFNDFDIEELSKYAKAKGVKIIGHNETAGATKNYETQLEEAFGFCNKYGITTVKTGYVAPYLDKKELHDGQYGVRHMQKVVQTASRYGVCIVNHEPVMPTGVCRTWPNLMSQEGMRGQEWDARSDDGGNPPSHTVVLPFTRGLAGPMDFTPGTFNFKNMVKPHTRVKTTLAKQLALYVVIYSPVQMASDMVENYTGQPAFQFIRDVAVDWENTIIPNADIGNYLTVVRKARNSSEWFLGSITNEESRTIEVTLDFLPEGRKFRAQFYEDSEDTDWQKNPTAVRIHTEEVNNKTKLRLNLAASGGVAIRFVPF